MSCRKKLKLMTEGADELKFMIKDLYRRHMQSTHDSIYQTDLMQFMDSCKNNNDFETQLKSSQRFSYLLEFFYVTDNHEVFAVSKFLKLYPKVTGIPDMYFYSEEDFPYVKWETYVFTELITKVIKKGLYAYLQLLVKYGLTRFFPEVQKNSMEQAEVMYSRITDLRKSWLSAQTGEEVQSGFMYFGWHSSAVFSRYNPNLRRKILITIALNTIVELQWRKRDGSHEMKLQQCQRSLDCINLLIRSTPEPFLTYLDIEKFLAVLPEHRLGKEFLEGIWKLFKQAFPGVQEKYHPRSLADLTRCRIRECLRTKEPLADQVSKLKVPVPIKEYILFHNEKIEDDLEMDYELQKHYAILLMGPVSMRRSLQNRGPRDNYRDFFRM